MAATLSAARSPPSSPPILKSALRSPVHSPPASLLETSFSTSTTTSSGKPNHSGNGGGDGGGDGATVTVEPAPISDHPAPPGGHGQGGLSICHSHSHSHSLSPPAPSPGAASSSSNTSTPSTPWVPHVSFDATEVASGGGGTGIEQSFTLRASTANYHRTRESRSFLVATDLNEYSVHALNWCSDNLLEDGDEVIVLRVLDLSTSNSSLSSRPMSSSGLPPSSLSETAREEAQQLITSVIERNNSFSTRVTSKEDISSLDPVREISITVEFVIGKVHESIQKMISIYKPDSLVVGTRGRTDSVWKSAFIGSVSRYCVANSPVPVIVVRPAIKVRKSVQNRADRQSYLDLVEGQGAKPTKAKSDLGMYKSSTLPSKSEDAANMPSKATPATGRGSGKTGIKLLQTKTMPL